MSRLEFPDPGKRIEYEKYINSAQWKRFRAYAIEQAGGKCAKCGISKWSAKLEVHHITYERLKRERLQDVVVLCPACHEKADEVRRDDVRRRNWRALQDARLNGWATKVYGEDWQETEDYGEVQNRFVYWLERQGA